MRMRTGPWILSGILVLISGGCDTAGSGDGTGSASGLVSAAEGGSVVSSDGLLTLSIPPGALQQDTAITIEVLSPRPPEVAGFDGAGPAYRLGPNGLTFDLPVVVMLDQPKVEPVGGQVVLPLAALVLVSDDGAAEMVDNLVSGAVEGDARLVGEISHFSTLVDWRIGVQIEWTEEASAAAGETFKPDIKLRHKGAISGQLFPVKVEEISKSISSGTSFSPTEPATYNSTQTLEPGDLVALAPAAEFMCDAEVDPADRWRLNVVLRVVVPDSEFIQGKAVSYGVFGSGKCFDPACCLPNGDCTPRAREACVAGGGVSHSPAVCEDVRCGAAQSACCTPAGCVVTTPELCENEGGTPRGEATCDGVECTEPVIGACCTNDECAAVLQTECAAMPDSRFHEGRRCDDVACGASFPGFWTMRVVDDLETCEGRSSTTMSYLFYDDGTWAHFDRRPRLYRKIGTWSESGGAVTTTGCRPPPESQAEGPSTFEGTYDPVQQRLVGVHIQRDNRGQVFEFKLCSTSYGALGGLDCHTTVCDILRDAQTFSFFTPGNYLDVLPLECSETSPQEKACCVGGEDACMMATHSECIAMGGVLRSGGCPGACEQSACKVGPSCVNNPSFECVADGGEAVLGSKCEACCIEGSCSDQIAGDCRSAGGNPMPGGVCADIPDICR